MPRSPEQNEAMRAATRERVRTAATRLFARKGYAAVSMRPIAARAGISIGSIYRHFATKEELFDDLVAEAALGLASVTERFETAADPVAALRSFTEGFLGDLAAGGEALEFYLLMNQVLVQADPSPAVRDLVERQRALSAATVALIERDRHRFRTGSAAELAACFFAALSGLVTMCSALGEDVSVPSVDTVMGFVVREGDNG